MVSSPATLEEFCGGFGVEAALNLGNGAGIAGKAWSASADHGQGDIKT